MQIPNGNLIVKYPPVTFFPVNCLSLNVDATFLMTFTHDRVSVHYYQPHHANG